MDAASDEQLPHVLGKVLSELRYEGIHTAVAALGANIDIK